MFVQFQPQYITRSIYNNLLTQRKIPVFRGDEPTIEERERRLKERENNLAQREEEIKRREQDIINANKQLDQRVRSIKYLDKNAQNIVAGGLRSLYNIPLSEGDTINTKDQQILHVAQLLNAHKEVLGRADIKTASGLIKILKDKDGNIPAVLLTFLERLFNIKTERTDIETIKEILDFVRDKNGQYDYSKGGLFLGTYTLDNENLRSTLDYMYETYSNNGEVKKAETPEAKTTNVKPEANKISIRKKLNEIKEREKANGNETVLYVLDTFFKPTPANVRFLDLISQYPEYGSRSDKLSDYYDTRNHLVLTIINGWKKSEEQFDLCTSMLKRIVEDPKLAHHPVIKNNLLRFIDIENKLEYKFVSDILNKPEIYSNEEFVKHLLQDHCAMKSRILTHEELTAKQTILKYCIDLGMLKDDVQGHIAGDIVQKTRIPEQIPLWKRYLEDRSDGHIEWEVRDWKKQKENRNKKEHEMITRTTDLRNAISCCGLDPDFAQIVLGNWNEDYFDKLTPHHMVLAMGTVSGGTTKEQHITSLRNAINHRGTYANTYYTSNRR